jgi:hypothetical protein
MAQGGNTTVTATVQDNAGNLYTNSEVRVSFFDPGTSGKLPLISGSTFQKQFTAFSTDSFGNFTMSLPDNGVIGTSSGATGTQWNFSICYNDRATCFSTKITINCASNLPATCTSNTINITATLQAASAPVPISTVSSLLSRNNTFTGNNTHSGTETFTGTVTACLVNGMYIAGSSCYATIAAAVTAAGSSGMVYIPASYAGTDNVPNLTTTALLDARENANPLGENFAISLGGPAALIRSARPQLDSVGSVIPAGGDVGLESNAAADLHLRTTPLILTSNTAVVAPGISTITVACGTNCISGLTVTGNLYPGQGSVVLSGANIVVTTGFFTPGAPGVAGTDINRESLSPAISGCPSSPPVGTFCVASGTTITANFQNAHATTPLNVYQWGAIFLDGYQFQTLDTNNTTPVFSVQHFGNSITNREFRLQQGGNGKKVLETGNGAGVHQMNFFGSAGTNPGFVLNSSDAGNGGAQTIEIRDNNFNQTTWLRIGVNGPGDINSLGGYYPLTDFGTQLGSTSRRFNNMFASKFSLSEGVAPPAAANYDICYGDSVAHALVCSYNNGAFFPVTQTIASGTATMTTAAIAAGAYGASVTPTITSGSVANVLAVDTIIVTPNAQQSTTNAPLKVSCWPAAGSITCAYFNPTAGSITPTAETENVRVTR